MSDRFQDLYNSYQEKFDTRNKEYQQYNPGADYYEDTWRQWQLNRGLNPEADTIIKQNQQTKQEPNQPSGGDKDDKPLQDTNLSEIIWGLPPILFSSDRAGTPDIVNEQLLRHSFPILTIGEVELNMPTDTGKTKKPSINIKGQPYKFAVKNEGGTTYTISNEYGPSNVEEYFQKIEGQLSNEVFQLARSNRLLNGMFKPVYDKLKPTVDKATGALKQDILGIVNNATDATKNTSLSGVPAGIFSIVEAGAKALFMGGKIDIPNVWKGSSGPISYNGTIILHCMSPDDDKEYKHYITDPLRILYRLASPHIMNENGSEGDNNQNNDILTYENPPYITATVDGIFRTHIGAITNFSVNIDHKYQSFSKGGRPWLVTVQLTITDLYNVIVWNDKKGQIGPNATDIIDLLERDNSDSAAGKLDERLSYNLDPCGFSGWKDDKPSNSSGGTSDISNIANTISNTANQVVPNSVNEQISLTPEIETILSNRTNDSLYDSWRQATNLSRDIYGNISTSLGDSTSISLVHSDLLNNIMNSTIPQASNTNSNIINSTIAGKWGLNSGSGGNIIDSNITSKWRLRV